MIYFDQNREIGKADLHLHGSNGARLSYESKIRRNENGLYVMRINKTLYVEPYGTKIIYHFQDDKDFQNTQGMSLHGSKNSKQETHEKSEEKQHEELMKEYKEQINNSLKELIDSETYPNFTKIEANDNFTEFKITTKSAQLDFNESFSVLAFYMYGGLYSVFSGEEAGNISVTFINADSGEVIRAANSSEMDQ